MSKNQQAWAAELVGTFGFLTIVIGSVIVATGGLSNYGLLGIATAHGVGLAAMVSAFGSRSGGHFNPAVTIGAWLGRQIDTVAAAGYIVAQVAGGLAAGLFLRITFPELVWRPSNLGTPALGLNVSTGKGLLLEAVFTFIFFIAIWGTGIDQLGPKIGGLAIGFALFGVLLIDGPLTGAGLNPARYLASAVVSGHMTNWWVYIVGPVIGGAVIGLGYETVFGAGWPWRPAPSATVVEAAPVEVPAPKKTTPRKKSTARKR